MSRIRRNLTLGVEGFSFYEYQKAKKAAQAKGTPETPKEDWIKLFAKRVGPETPEAPKAPETLKADVLRPGYSRRLAGLVDPNEYYNVPGLWGAVNDLRRHPYYRGEIVLDVLTLASLNREVQFQKFVEAFRIPEAVYRGMNSQEAEQLIVWPLLWELERGLNELKPLGMPGSVLFNYNDEGSLVLEYRER